MKKQKGFSLIELLIVVAIILIIAAIAIPNLMRARIAANESSAASSMRTIVTAEISYNSTYQQGFTDLVSLGGAAPCTTAVSTAACLIDNVLASGTKSGYTIAANPQGANNSAFVASATPLTANVTGVSTFCTDPSGVVRKDPAGSAAPTTVTACDALPAMQ